MDVILRKIHGLGWTILKTNVDREHARLIQSALAAPSAQPARPPVRRRLLIRFDQDPGKA